jgi:hypothetical protein
MNMTFYPNIKWNNLRLFVMVNFVLAIVLLFMNGIIIYLFIFKL